MSSRRKRKRVPSDADSSDTDSSPDFELPPRRKKRKVSAVRDDDASRFPASLYVCHGCVPGDSPLKVRVDVQTSQAKFQPYSSEYVRQLVASDVSHLWLLGLSVSHRITDCSFEAVKKACDDVLAKYGYCPEHYVISIKTKQFEPLDEDTLADAVKKSKRKTSRSGARMQFRYHWNGKQRMKLSSNACWMRCNACWMREALGDSFDSSQYLASVVLTGCRDSHQNQVQPVQNS